MIEQTVSQILHNVTGEFDQLAAEPQEAKQMILEVEKESKQRQVSVTTSQDAGEQGASFHERCRHRLRSSQTVRRAAGPHYISLAAPSPTPLQDSCRGFGAELASGSVLEHTTACVRHAWAAEDR